MTKQELKDKLLNTAYFINNKYLDQYIQLVYNYNTDEAYTEKHHILQRCYYKYSNIPIDNDENNIGSFTFEFDSFIITVSYYYIFIIPKNKKI